MVRNLIERFKQTRLTPGGEMAASSMLKEQVFVMEIYRAATGKIEHRVCYFHPNPFKRYWVRLLLTLRIIKGDKYCGNCTN